MATVLKILRTSHDDNPEDIAVLLSMTKDEYEKQEYGEDTPKVRLCTAPSPHPSHTYLSWPS